MEVYVLVVTEHDFNDVSCYCNETKAIEAIVTDMKDRNNSYDEDNAMTSRINEMKADIEEYGYWEDGETRYDIHKCKVN